MNHASNAIDVNHDLMCLVSGIMIDHETPEPCSPSQGVTDAYEQIKADTAAFLNSCVDPSAALQESYPVPVFELDGKRYACLDQKAAVE